MDEGTGDASETGDTCLIVDAGAAMVAIDFRLEEEHQMVRCTCGHQLAIVQKIF